VIPTVISQALACDSLHLGTLTPTRDFVFVLDTVRGLIDLAEADGLEYGTYNIATGVEVSVADVVEVVGRLLGRTLTVHAEVERLRPGRSEVQQLLGDSTRLREATGWAPHTSLQDGLRAVIDWMRTTGLPARSRSYAV
jgi:nucleoside-diphosphate-sugar epimerase